MENLIKEIRNKYVSLYRQHHKLIPSYGGKAYPNNHAYVLKLVKETKSTILLDYGCGKATQYTEKKLHKDWGFMPSLYDPGVPKYSVLPVGEFDGIYSTDVFEHIPKEVLPSVIEYIFKNAKKFVFLGICVRPAIHILPNGENAHCTIKPIEWWVDMVNTHAPKKVYTHIHTYGLENKYEILNK